MNFEYDFAKCLHLMKEKVIQLSSDDGLGSSNLKFSIDLGLPNLAFFRNIKPCGW